MELTDGSRVAVIGGGPAGSFVSYFLLEIADRVDLHLEVDIYEAKDFARLGPGGCNHCGGIISESLVQHLAAEGLTLPDSVVQRGVDAYVLHTDLATVRIGAPEEEKRIAAIHRGGGPIGAANRWIGFDLHLLELAQARGANLVHARVDEVALDDGHPVVKARGMEPAKYDLLIGAVGVNTTAVKLFESLGFEYLPPTTTKTYICEFHYGRDALRECLGSAMHVFLVDMPHIEFAALIPKGEFATLVLLGDNIDKQVVDRFLALEAVRECLPAGQTPTAACHCMPKINLGVRGNLYTDRVVVIGDAGVSRLYKDGIGAAYKTAKACANTVIFDGVGMVDFERYYAPTCKDLSRDNALGKVVFRIVTLFRKSRILRRGMLRMVVREQSSRVRPMSTVLWDTFTGSAPYREIVLRSLHPAFLFGLARETVAGLFETPRKLQEVASHES